MEADIAGVSIKLPISAIKSGLIPMLEWQSNLDD